MNSNRRTLIFDVDGTLVDSTYQHAMAWGRAFRACGLSVPMWRVHRTIGMGGDLLVTELCGSAVEERMGDELRSQWAEAYEELGRAVHALPGVQDLMESVRRQGHTVAVASSGSRRDTERSLEVAEVRRYVDSVTTGDDVEQSKPEPDVIALAWRSSGGGLAGVIGDSVYDVQAATKLGLPCVGVRTGGFAVQELEEAGAVLVVDDLSSLIDHDWAALIPGDARPSLS